MAKPGYLDDNAKGYYDSDLNQVVSEVPIISPGSVLQYTYSRHDTLINLGADSAYFNLMNVTITPKRSNSIMVIQHTSSGIHRALASAVGRILRKVSGQADQEIYLNNRWSYANDPSYYSPVNFGFTCNDTPGTTSAVTYQLQGLAQTTGTDSNFRWNDVNGSMAFLHVWEIGQ